MLNTIAYCLGFTSNGLSPVEDENSVTFVTKDADDQWTLVDVENGGKSAVCEYPTPPPSPKLENSWLVTPPPCFNAEGSGPVAMLTSRENLLIEHPSMFVCPSSHDEDEDCCSEQPIETNKVVEVHKPTPSSSLRRSHRRATRRANTFIFQQHRRSNPFKRTGSDVARRNNKSFQKMRQLVQQPRKRC